MNFFHRSPVFLRHGLAALLGLCAALTCLATTAATSTPVAARHGYDYYEIGNLKAVRPDRTEAALMLMGGGSWPPGAFAWFVAKGGHGHFLILRASGDDGMQKELYNDIGGVASVQTLVFHSREAASDPQVLDIVRQADGIFIAGGDQANYVHFWKGTPLNTLLNEHVAHGKPIGGTSAGLAILGGHGYGALDGGSITSDEALGEPLGAGVTMVGDFMRLPNMRHVVTDTHFAVRQRLGRLIVFLANLEHAGYAGLVGLGVDQDSALCVEASGVGHLYTIDKGFAWLVQPHYQSATIAGHTPLSESGIHIAGVGSQGSVDLRNFQVTNPAFELVGDVRRGKLILRSKPPASP